VSQEHIFNFQSNEIWRTVTSVKPVYSCCVSMKKFVFGSRVQSIFFLCFWARYEVLHLHISMRFVFPVHQFAFCLRLGAQVSSVSGWVTAAVLFRFGSSRSDFAAVRMVILPGVELSGRVGLRARGTLEDGCSCSRFSAQIRASAARSGSVCRSA
jgi:hypothetical protein